MLERISNLPDGVIGLRASGRVTAEDYHAALEPLLDEARREGRGIRFLYHFAPTFEGFSAGAMWQDLRMGLQHLRRFERCAVVSESATLRDTVALIGAMMPCPVRAYDEPRLDDAISWLSTAGAGARMSHRLLPDVGVLVIEPHGALCAEDFESISLTVDPWLESHGGLHGLVIHVARFPGWENVAALIGHVRFVRDHHRFIERVALVTDSVLGGLVERVTEHFAQPTVRQFEFGELEQAIDWAGSSPGQRPRTNGSPSAVAP